MDAYGGQSDHRAESRVERLYRRLAGLLGRLPADRQRAFREYLESTTNGEADSNDGLRPDESGERPH